MANGASTALLQTAIKTLLQGRPPSPLSPVPIGELTPPGGPLLLPPGPAPEPAPVAPLPARDESLIEQLAGAPPVAPVVQPDPLILKIARALIGFGAGVQGQGPQYLAQLEEERQRPQREFRAATEAFESRRRRAVEVAEDKRQREQAQTQAQADAQSEREFRQWVQRTGVQDSMALEQLRQTFELNKLREAERIADERLLKQQRLVFNKELSAQIKFYRANGIKDPMQARRLALNDFSDFATELGITVPALTKADNGMLAKVEAYVSRLQRIGQGSASGAGSGASVNAKAEQARQLFQDVKQQVIDAEGRGDSTGAEQLRKKMINIHNSLAGRFPGVFELGYGDSEGRWPYVKYRNEAAQGPQQSGASSPDAGARVATQADLENYARENNVSIEQARADAKRAGYIVK